MQSHTFATTLLGQLSPQLLAASLLVLASLCFFCASLVLLLVMRPRSHARPDASASAVPTPMAAPSVAAIAEQANAGSSPTGTPAAPRRARSRLRRRGGASLPAAAQGEEGRDFSREISLAQQGSDAQQLMKDCGLTQLEANLVVKLYGHAAAESPRAALG